VNYLSLGQSNSADWLYSTQLLRENADPMWSGDPPSDLVLTIAIVDARGFVGLSGRDYIAALPDGHIAIRVPHGAMRALWPDVYDVHIQIDKAEARFNIILGRLPVREGVAL
jgi:hypothetical protein